MKQLSGHTIPYAVLGHPIGHTLSPVMHNASFEALGLDAIYCAYDVAPEHLMQVLPAMEQMGFGGVNLTIPLKEVAFAGLKQLDPSRIRISNSRLIPVLGGPARACGTHRITGTTADKVTGRNWSRNRMHGHQVSLAW